MNRIEAIAQLESFKSKMVKIRKELDFNISLVYDQDMMTMINYIKEVTDYDKGWNDGIWTISDILNGVYENTPLEEFKEYVDRDFSNIKHN